jgi:hypothetical protein
MVLLERKRKEKKSKEGGGEEGTGQVVETKKPTRFNNK